MPGPSIPRSSSHPQLLFRATDPHHHYPRSHFSAPSSSPGTSWATILVRRLKLVRKRDEPQSQYQPELNQENLRAHDIKYAAAADYSSSSPYYYQLTKFRGLAHPSLVADPRPSPGRRSQGTSSTTAVSTSSLSNLISKLEELILCFSLNNKSKTTQMFTSSNTSTTTSGLKKDLTIVKKDDRVIMSSSSQPDNYSVVDQIVVKKEKKAAVSNHYDLQKRAAGLIAKAKPLRERVSEATVDVSPSPSPSPASLSLSSKENDQHGSGSAEKKKEDSESDQKEFVWADKYRPKALEDFICNREKAIHLQASIREGSICGHFIFEGAPGVGKRTMIWAMMREIFGPEKIKVTKESKAFNVKGEVVTSIQVEVKQSPQHVELNLSELRGYEKHVIIELFKETHKELPNKSPFPCGLDHCRAIILHEADKLSTDALLYIRWLLERYKGCNKVLFCCNDVSKLQPVKELCTTIQLSPPSTDEIVEVLQLIAKQEGIGLPHEMAMKIVDKSRNNLRQAIRSFEATWRNNYPFTEGQLILTGWEDDIANIAKNIIEEQSPKQLFIIRGKLQGLIAHDVPSDFIFKSLVGEIKHHLCEELKPRIDSLYEEYNRNAESLFESEKQFGSENSKKEEPNLKNNEHIKNIQHYLRIEEFIAKFMSCYKHSAI
ncbi:Replication factor C subunit 3 [Quillaja saponaria]|uniref:Replication factor C subunit 3 n=1 Tax=Quillaja saponaria TaxID=32244 RepID=A0AAD7PD82_QUISA|nr:Replication factor C subunit 3 [Quillaja saponaria]